MPNVVIREKDLTSPGTSATNNNIAYIPGFADWRETNFDDVRTRASAYKPRLCTTVAEFESYFGKHPVKFAKAQPFPKYEENVTAGFSDVAIPTGNVNMFNAGDVDPSYVMAKELLAQGLSVVYEAVNTTMESADSTPIMAEISVEPKNWATNYADYFKGDTKTNPTTYTAIDGEKKTTAPEFATYTYYEKSETSFTVASKTNVPGKAFTSIYLANFPATVLAGDDTIIPFLVGDSSGHTHDFAYVGELFSKQLPVYGKKVSGSRQKYSSLSEMPANYEKSLADYFICPVADVASAADSDYVALSTVYGLTGKLSQLTDAPTDWNTNYWNYYTLDEGVYVNVADYVYYTAPDFTTISNSNGVYLFNGYNAGISVNSMYTAFNTIYDNLADRGEFNIKFITSGGYPTFEHSAGATNKMINLAHTRGDAFVLVDATNNPSRSLNPINPSSVYYAVVNSTDFNAYGEYATMVYPYCNFKRVTSDEYANTTESNGLQLPGSFAYLASTARSLEVNPSWLAIAGFKRGVIPNLDSNEDNGYYPLCVDETLTSTIADAYQPRNDISICPITYVNGAGYCIWGNRTLKRNNTNLVATSFLNIRNLVCDIKKTTYESCVRNMFEQDSEVLWINFVSNITPLLDKMKTGAGIEDYKIIREETTEKAKVVATIRIIPVYAVEDWDITIVLTDSDVTVS